MKFEAKNHCGLENNQYLPKLATFKILEISLVNLSRRVGRSGDMTPCCFMAELVAVIR